MIIIIIIMMTLIITNKWELRHVWRLVNEKFAWEIQFNRFYWSPRDVTRAYTFCRTLGREVSHIRAIFQREHLNSDKPRHWEPEKGLNNNKQNQSSPRCTVNCIRSRPLHLAHAGWRAWPIDAVCVLLDAILTQNHELGSINKTPCVKVKDSRVTVCASCEEETRLISRNFPRLAAIRIIFSAIEFRFLQGRASSENWN